MTIAELVEGLLKLNAPNQGMSYHGGGYRRGSPKYNSYTGEPVTPRYDPAVLNVYSDRAKFLYRLIENGEHLAALLCPVERGAGSPSEASAATSVVDDPKSLDWKTRAFTAERERDEALSRVGELERGLKTISGSLIAAQILMETAGRWRNSAGYLTDAALWIDKASNAAALALSPTRGGGDEGASVAGPDVTAQEPHRFTQSYTGKEG